MMYTDQMGRSVDIPGIPNRIISLVPSQTELLFYLGLSGSVVGITKFCVHPNSWFRTKTRVGGTKSVNFEIISRLRPDLIIGNKEENTREDIERLAADYPVWVSDVNELEDALSMIGSIAGITGTSPGGTSLVSEIKKSFGQLPTLNAHLRVAYLIWQNPLIAVAADTFINDMLKKCGFVNVFEDATRYPQTSTQELTDKKCELVFLSSEPFPFASKHLREMQLQLPGCRLQLINGEMFSWYGPRLLQSASYFGSLISSLA